ncbi:MAG: hypothetical protein AAF108_10315, partial [Planctomycetota bacterium]
PRIAPARLHTAPPSQYGSVLVAHPVSSEGMIFAQIDAFTTRSNTSRLARRVHPIGGNTGEKTFGLPNGLPDWFDPRQHDLQSLFWVTQAPERASERAAG